MKIFQNRFTKILSCLSAGILLASCATNIYGLTDTDLQEIADNGAYKFDIHFSVISDRTDVTDKATPAQLLEEVRILNTYFVSDSGENLVEFVLKNISLHADIAGSSCALANMGSDAIDHSSQDWADAINDCDNDPDVIDPEAINFLVYDDWGGDFTKQGGHGRRNGNKPYVLIDYARLDHIDQSPEEHEMGHAFGLSHICDPSVTDKFMSSNIMTSANKYTDANGNSGICSDDTGGRGGARDIGFNQDQVDTILFYANKIQAALRP